MVCANASRTAHQHRRQQGVSVDAIASCEGAALGLWVDPSRPHPDSHSATSFLSNDLLRDRAALLMSQTLCNRLPLLSCSFAALHQQHKWALRTNGAGYVCNIVALGTRCNAPCKSNKQTCMRGQMMAAGCKQAPRMGNTCGWLS